MKGILEFDLPTDNEYFNGASKSIKFWLCLSELEEYIKSELEEYIKNGSTNESDYTEKVYKKFWEILDDHNVTLEEYS
jgi:hypothetical protein